MVEAERGSRTPSWPRLALGAAALVGLGLLALAWTSTPLRVWLDPERLASLAAPYREGARAPLVVLGLYGLGALGMLPISVLIMTTTLLFGPWLGFVLALAGCLFSAALSYGLGALLGREVVRTLAGERLAKVHQRLEQHGALKVALIRVLPVAPFSVINLAAGAMPVRFRDFFLGTALGLIPAVLAFGVLADRFAAAVREPGPLSFAILGFAVVLLLAAALVVRHRLR